MRRAWLVLALVCACKKTEKKKTVLEKKPPSAASQGYASEVKPVVPVDDLTPAAVTATIDIMNAVAPITTKWGNAGATCANGLPELDKILAAKQPQLDAIHAAQAKPASAKNYIDAYFDQHDTPLSQAKSAALGPALPCPALSDRVQEAIGFKMKH